ncbi:bis(5'-nucleosyl)-tetraphosphatase [Neorhodopirellula pilleata]|uniref:Bis(5'-nucleosyl)-tetraphosphatase [asymmetrical] n=1 Tax=Neorhodopirellula pilleata TaxID=2714738 RepID=A0A5C6AB23_9BACT|nr:NUDIX domain-containing protein [Neorhodopirellula pilleata]TWT96355.1 dihydroneopterin triphosphate pyrophosphatase [Neorhodopirellula pilleata]
MKKERTNPVRAAGVLLMTETLPQKFLLMRHKDRWDLPKGHCDGNETYLETAHREMEEETGIPASTCRFEADFQFDIQYEVTYKKSPGQVFQKKIRYFLAWIPNEVKIEVTEHEGYQWTPWQPPHQIQIQTIDPLLASVEAFLKDRPNDAHDRTPI